MLFAAAYQFSDRNTAALCHCIYQQPIRLRSAFVCTEIVSVFEIDRVQDLTLNFSIRIRHKESQWPSLEKNIGLTNFSKINIQTMTAAAPSAPSRPLNLLRNDDYSALVAASPASISSPLLGDIVLPIGRVQGALPGNLFEVEMPTSEAEAHERKRRNRSKY